MTKTKIKFNPDTMTVSDLKNCAQTLRDLLHAYDRGLCATPPTADDATFAKMYEHVALRVAQVRDSFDIY